MTAAAQRAALDVGPAQFFSSRSLSCNHALPLLYRHKSNTNSSGSKRYEPPTKSSLNSTKKRLLHATTPIMKNQVFPSIVCPLFFRHFQIFPCGSFFFFMSSSRKPHLGNRQCRGFDEDLGLKPGRPAHQEAQGGEKLYPRPAIHAATPSF